MLTVLFLGGGKTAPKSYSLSCAPGSYTLSGNAATLKSSRKLSAAAGAYSLSGNAATLAAGRKLFAAGGAYSVTGRAAELSVGRRLVADTGAYVVSGQQAEVQKSQVASAYQLVAEAGAYVLSGAGASLVWSGQQTPAAGNYPTRKRRHFVEHGNSVYVFDTLAEAERFKASLKPQPKDAPKRRKAAKSAPMVLDDVPVIDLPALKAWAHVEGQMRAFNDAYASRHYELILGMFQKKEQADQDEDDIESLLMLI